MPAAAEAAADPHEGMFRVWDTNAVMGARSHQPVPGKTYQLNSEGDGTPMPAEHAYPFLRDKAFRVHNEKGQPVASMPSGATAQTASEKGGIFLEIGETVAKFAELTQPALLGRAAAIPGGERLKKNEARGTIIKFLTEHAKATARPDEDRITDPAVAAIGEDAVDQMVSDAGGLEAMK